MKHSASHDGNRICNVCIRNSIGSLITSLFNNLCFQPTMGPFKKQEYEDEEEEDEEEEEEEEEEDRKEMTEAEALEKLKEIGVCPQSYQWIRGIYENQTCQKCNCPFNNGYRCAGGTHYVCISCVNSA